MLSLPFFILNNNLLEGLANYNWISVIITMSTFVAFSFGLFVSLFKMQRIIRKKRTVPDFFTGATCCPRFLFTFFGSCYWIIRALFHGTGFLQLYNKAEG
jgi:hypothetical protein